MDSLNSNRLSDEIKKELEAEIKEANDFLNWIYGRIEARSLDKENGILNILINLKETQEHYVERIQTEYFEKYA